MENEKERCEHKCARNFSSQNLYVQLSSREIIIYSLGETITIHQLLLKQEVVKESIF